MAQRNDVDLSSHCIAHQLSPRRPRAAHHGRILQTAVHPVALPFAREQKDRGPPTVASSDPGELRIGTRVVHRIMHTGKNSVTLNSCS